MSYPSPPPANAKALPVPPGGASPAPMVPVTVVTNAPTTGAGQAPTLPGLERNQIVLERVQGANTVVEVHEYRHLGITDIFPGQTVFPSRGLRRVHIHMLNPSAEIRCESGALHYMWGHITIHADIGGVGGALKKMIQSKLTNETTFKPRYVGDGHIMLEPSHYTFTIVTIDTTNDQRGVIVEKGYYFASEGSVEVSVFRNNVSSGLFGGEGWFQVRLVGRGWVVLALPIPMCEVQKIHLQAGERCSVEGPYAFFRRGNVEFKVERATKGFMGTAASGQGLLSVFEAYGPAEVWVAATHRPSFVEEPEQHTLEQNIQQARQAI